MDIITIPANRDDADQFKGQDVVAILTDDTRIDGKLISINSKGWNFDVDGTVVSRSLSRVASVTVTVANADDLTDEMNDAGEMDLIDDDDSLSDADTMDDLVAQLDGATTAELANVFGMAAKELRVHLRALGMGVGKGHRYHLTAAQITTVRTALTVNA